MSWITFVIELVPYMIKLILAVEPLFGDGEGQNKKALVMSVAESLFAAIIGVSTGEQKKLWVSIEPVVSMLIDSACGFLFPHDEG